MSNQAIAIRPSPNGHDQTNEVRLKDDRGRLRLPAYILIALQIAVAALLLMAVGLLAMDGLGLRGGNRIASTRRTGPAPELNRKPTPRRRATVGAS